MGTGCKPHSTWTIKAIPFYCIALLLLFPFYSIFDSIPFFFHCNTKRKNTQQDFTGYQKYLFFYSNLHKYTDFPSRKKTLLFLLPLQSPIHLVNCLSSISFTKHMSACQIHEASAGYGVEVCRSSEKRRRRLLHGTGAGGGFTS